MYTYNRMSMFYYWIYVYDSYMSCFYRNIHTNTFNTTYHSDLRVVVRMFKLECFLSIKVVVKGHTLFIIFNKWSFYIISILLCGQLFFLSKLGQGASPMKNIIWATPKWRVRERKCIEPQIGMPMNPQFQVFRILPFSLDDFTLFLNCEHRCILWQPIVPLLEIFFFLFTTSRESLLSSLECWASICVARVIMDSSHLLMGSWLSFADTHVSFSLGLP